MLSLSNSEIALWLTCKRSWYVQYYLQKQPRNVNPVGATQLGTRIHASLEGYYNPLIKADPVQTLRSIYNMDCEAFPEQEDELLTEQLLADAMITGYMEWIDETGADIGLEVLSVEESIELPFEPDKFDDVYIRGRLDMRVRTRHGSVLFMDHKTCIAFLTEDYLDRDPQAKFYMMLERLSGKDAELWSQGGIFNMLRKVKRGPKAKPPFYKREHVTFNNDVMNSMYYRTYSVVSEIVEARRRLDAGESHRLVVYASPGKDCVWKCPLASGLCSMMDDGSDYKGVLEDEFVSTDPYLRYYETSYLEKLDQMGKI
jgi:hypothetical protein